VFGEPQSPFTPRITFDDNAPRDGSTGYSQDPFGFSTYPDYSGSSGWTSTTVGGYGDYGYDYYGSSGYSSSFSNDFFGGGYDYGGYGGYGGYDNAGYGGYDSGAYGGYDYGGYGSYDWSGSSGYTPQVTTVGRYDEGYGATDNWSSAFWGDDTFGSLGSYGGWNDPWSSGAFTPGFFENLGFENYADPDPYGSYLYSEGDYNYYGGGQRLGVIGGSSIYDTGYSSYDSGYDSSSDAYGSYSSYGSSYDSSYWLEQLQSAQDTYNQRYNNDDDYGSYGSTPTFNNAIDYGEYWTNYVRGGSY
jgi:hypothetical protein